MPHAIEIAGDRRVLLDELTIESPGAGPSLLLLRLATGDALLIAPGALVDGAPPLGGICVIERGAGARVRTVALAVEIAWQADPARRPVGDAQRCRLCFGRFVAQATAASCACEALFHDACESARSDCPGCGAPRRAASGEDVAEEGPR